MWEQLAGPSSGFLAQGAIPLLAPSFVILSEPAGRVEGSQLRVGGCTFLLLVQKKGTKENDTREGKISGFSPSLDPPSLKRPNGACEPLLDFPRMHPGLYVGAGIPDSPLCFPLRGNCRLSLPVAEKESLQFPQRSKSRRISVSPNGFSGTARWTVARSAEHCSAAHWRVMRESVRAFPAVRKNGFCSSLTCRGATSSPAGGGTIRLRLRRWDEAQDPRAGRDGLIPPCARQLLQACPDYDFKGSLVSQEALIQSCSIRIFLPREV